VPSEHKTIPQSRLEEFAAACRRAASFGLMQCSSGNMSCRLDEKVMLVKASRAWMCQVTAADVAICRIADGRPLNDRTPSVEIGFHSGVLRERAGVNVVLHFQTPAATTLACGDPAAVNYNVIPEIPYYIGPIGIVPYLPPGSPQLAAAVTAVMKNHDLAMMSSHGQVTVGRSFDDAIQKAVFFELACQIIVQGGQRIRPLAAEVVAELRAAGSGGGAV